MQIKRIKLNSKKNATKAQPLTFHQVSHLNKKSINSESAICSLVYIKSPLSRDNVIFQYSGYMIPKQIRYIAGVGLYVSAVTEGHIVDTHNIIPHQGSSLGIPIEMGKCCGLGQTDEIIQVLRSLEQLKREASVQIAVHHQSLNLLTSVNGHSSIALHICKVTPLSSERSYSSHQQVSRSVHLSEPFFQGCLKQIRDLLYSGFFTALISANLL